MTRVSAVVSAVAVLALTGCGAKPTVDYRKSGQLEQAVKAQLESEGKTVEEVTCAGGGGNVICAYKLTTGFAAITHVRVASDGKTWSAL